MAVFFKADGRACYPAGSPWMGLLLSPRLALARTCRGRIARLRVAVPEDEGRYCLHWIDETAAAEAPPRLLYGRVQARGADAAAEPARSLAALGGMIAQAAPATLGLIAALGEEEDWVHWVVVDGDAPSLIPPQRATLIDKAMVGSQRWLPAFLLACIVAVASMLWLFSGAGDGFLMWGVLLALVASSLATLVTGIMLYEHAATLLENYRYREAIEASEAGLRRARAQAFERPAVASEPAVLCQGKDERIDADGDVDEHKDYDPLPPRRPPARGRKRRRRHAG